jgi:hypothetical protein
VVTTAIPIVTVGTDIRIVIIGNFISLD